PLQLGATTILHVLADGAPVSGATLRLLHGYRATTDETGRAVVRGLAPIDHSGLVVADGWANEWVHLSLDEDPIGVVERTIQVLPGARIEGVVLDEHGRPVEDATLWARSTDNGLHSYQVWTELDGN